MFGKDFEEDYIMRQIKNCIEAAVRLVCNVDTTAQIRQEMKEDAFANRLLEQARNGEFNEAENALYAKADERDPMTLRAGLIFYDYLNSLDESTLTAHDFSHEEVQDGLRSLLRTFGMGEMAELFTEEPAEEPAEKSEEPSGFQTEEELNPVYEKYLFCPYCGKKMDTGYVRGLTFSAIRKGALYWNDEVHQMTAFYNGQELHADSYQCNCPAVRAYKCDSCMRIIMETYVVET